MRTRGWWLALMLLPIACTFRVGAIKQSDGTGGNGVDLAMPDGPGGPADDLAMGPPADMSVAPPIDAALPPPPPDMTPACLRPGIIFCDDFESAKLLGWGPGQVHGKIGVDDLHVHHGQLALHAHQDVSVDGATALLLRGVPYPSPDIYLRAFVYTEAPPSTASLIRVQQSQGRQLSIDLQVSPTDFLMFDGKTQGGEPSTLVVPTGRWFCMQWHVHVATSGFAALGVDQDNWTSTTQDTTVDPGYDWLVVGLQSQGAGTANDVWIDELALSAAPIGCDDSGP